MDFSRFFRDVTVRPKPRFTFLGKSISETEMILRTSDGLYFTLREANEKLTDRAGGPNAKARVLIALQAYNMDSTFEQLAAACGLSSSSVEQHLSVVRQWLKDAFQLHLERSGERIFLVDQDTLRERANKLVANIEKLDAQLETVRSCANSLQQSGQTVALPAKAQAFLAAHEQCKQLEGASEG